MSERINIVTGSKWEKLAGFSRAVRIGNIIEIAGTVSGIENGKVIGGNDPYKQAASILKRIEKVLHDTGAAKNDVIRTRVYVTDKAFAEAVSKAHKEFFKKTNPVSTFIEVKSLISEKLLVEIEATAVL